MTSVQVLPGPGIVARFGDVLLWLEEGEGGGRAVTRQLLDLAQTLAEGGDSRQAGGRLAEVLRSDPLAVPAMVLVAPTSEGLQVVVHGWGRLLADGVDIDGGWADRALAPTTALAAGRGGDLLRVPTPGSVLDLRRGSTPGGGAAVALAAQDATPSGSTPTPVAVSPSMPTAVPTPTALPTPMPPDMPMPAPVPTPMPPGGATPSAVPGPPPDDSIDDTTAAAVSTSMPPADPAPQPAGAPAPTPAEPSPWAPAAPAPAPASRRRSPAPVAPASFEQVDLRAAPPRREPLPVGARGGAVAPTSGVTVKGVICSRGHFNNPIALFCGSCGISMGQVTRILQDGIRPSLGTLVLDDGTAFGLDTDHLIGSAPHAGPGGDARPVPIVDPTGQVAPLHAEVRLVGWDVVLVARAPTFVLTAGTQQWVPAPPGQPSPLGAGTRVAVGQRTFVVESNARNSGI